MKKLLLAIAIIMVFAISFSAAEWNGWWGYVTYKHSGDPAPGAMVIINEYEQAPKDTVYADEEGRYQYSCFEGYYDLAAKQNNYVHIKQYQYQTGDPGGTRCDFQIEIPNK